MIIFVLHIVCLSSSVMLFSFTPAFVVLVICLCCMWLGNEVWRSVCVVLVICLLVLNLFEVVDVVYRRCSILYKVSFMSF